jgi:hypothetical protein
MKTSRDMGVMGRIAAYIRDKGECSMGEVEIQLYVPAWKQYWLYRTFKEFYKDVELKRGTWRFKAETLNVKPEQLEPAPNVAQDILSVQPTQRQDSILRE